MSSLRMRCLEYVSANGNHMPYQDIAAGLKENPQRVRGALGDASKEGYLSFGRDDVSGQGGYSLTAKGKARIVNGHQTINGKQASENKKACDEREAAAHVMSAPCAISESESLVDALRKRISNLESDITKMRTLLASKTERIAKLEEENAELQDCTADDLTATVARLMQENAALRKQVADAEISINPIGYAHCWPDGFQEFDSEDAARADIEKSFAQSQGVNYPSFLCAILDKAELSVKWARS